MKVNVTIPDGDFADALVTEAARRNQSPARLLASFARTMLSKQKYHIPLSSLLSERERQRVHDDGSDRLRVRAQAVTGKSEGTR